MAILLDTLSVEPGDRAEVIATAVQQATAPAQIVVSDSGPAVSGRIEAWQFGSTDLRRIQTGGYVVRRTARLIRVAPAPCLMIFVSSVSTIRWRQGDGQYEIEPGQLYVADLNQPFEGDWRGGEVLTMQVPLELLGVPVETIRRAVGALSVSPMQRLVATHISLMASTADAIEADPAARDFGDACVDLARALISSDAVRKGDGTVLPAELLVSQIRDYVRSHLIDPDLSPARIARAHHISVRYLYKLCAEANFSLHQWIISQRLVQVHRALTSPRDSHRPIAVIAQQYGFRDPSHFSRSFRSAFGMTPREWRRMGQEAML